MAVYGLFNDGAAVLNAKMLRQIVALFSENATGLNLGVSGGVRMSTAAPHAMRVLPGSSGLNVTVNTGLCVIPASTLGEGAYVLVNDTVATVPLNPADGSQARYEIIVAYVTDTGGADSVYEVTKVTGAPAGSPAVPATPTGALSLGSVLVPAGATTPGELTVNDTRVQLSTILRASTGFHMYEPTRPYTAQTTSTSFTTLLSTFLVRRFANITVSVMQSTPAGTTGEVRLMANGIQIGSTDSTLPGSGFPPNFFGPLPASIQYGSTVVIEVQARVVTGPGPMSVKFVTAGGYG